MFKNIFVYIYTYMHAITISFKKRSRKFEGEWKEYMTGGRKVKAN